jgi:hypothetical protein
MSEEIAGRYAGYSTPELFELARAGESRLRPEAWQLLKTELRKRGLELTPEDESLASGPTAGSEPASAPRQAVTAGFDTWLVLFVVMMALNVVLRTYQTFAAFVALSWIGVFYALHAVILVIGIALVYHRDPLAPRYWRNVLILTAGLNVVLGAAHLMDWSRALLTATVLIGWAAYWQTSRRVRATFATVRAVETPTEVGAPRTSPSEELDGTLTQVESDAEPVPSVEELNAELDDARRQGNAAGAYIVVGLAITIGTYFMALAGGGRTYFIAWGAILFGLFGAARANARRKRARALLQYASDVVRPVPP